MSLSLLANRPFTRTPLPRSLGREALDRLRAADVRPAGFVPQVDIAESDEAYVVTAELAGVRGEDVEVVFDDGVLVLRGEKRRGAPEGASRRRVETASGAFERRVRFAAPVVAEDVTARHRDGLLTVTLPRPAAARPERFDVPVESA